MKARTSPLNKTASLRRKVDARQFSSQSPNRSPPLTSVWGLSRVPHKYPKPSTANEFLDEPVSEFANIDDLSDLP